MKLLIRFLYYNALQMNTFLRLFSNSLLCRLLLSILYRCILSLYFLCRLRILHLLYRSFACLFLC